MPSSWPSTASDSPFNLAWALGDRSYACCALGHFSLGMEVSDEAGDICRRYGFAARLGTALGRRGAIRAALGDLEGGIADCREGLALWQRQNAVFTTPWLACELAELLLLAERLEEARGVLDYADALVTGTDEAASLAECQRLRGVLAMREGNLSEAERWLEAAVATALAQSAHLYNLRATTRLAEVLEARGRQSEGMRRLQEVSAMFASSVAAPDVRIAKAVLRRLSREA